MSLPVRRGPMSFLVLDEIGLEGLEGITLPSLFVYLGLDLAEPLPLPLELQNQVWNFIKRNTHQLLFYDLPVERATVKYANRFDFVDPDFNVPIMPDKHFSSRYKFVPIDDGKIQGSCEYYKERKLIKDEEIRDMNIDEVLKRWGTRFVIVGSPELRSSSLTPANVPIPIDLTVMQYCVWEAIGRSRCNGETTSGTYSLLYFCKDTAVMFYLKNKLLRLGVISQHPFNEMRNDKLVATSLLTLPRFYSNYSDTAISIIEKLFSLVKDAPNNRVSVINLRSTIPTFERKKSFKRITLTHLFRQVFEMKTIPYSEANGLPRQKQNASTKEKGVAMVCLRNPNLTLEDLFTEGIEDKEELCINFYNEKHSFVDMRLKDEFYRAIARHGARGCTQSELCIYVSQAHLTVRQMVKIMLSDGLIRSYWTDKGRQRVNRYVAIEHIDQMKEQTTILLNEPFNFQYNELPNMAEDNCRLTDIPDILVNIKPYEYDEKNICRETPTVRQVARKLSILKLINENYIVPTSMLRTKILNEENASGYKDEICIKSLRRLIHNLLKNGSIRAYEITLQYEENMRLYRYVTHPKVDSDHLLLRQEILKLKSNLFLHIEKQRFIREQQVKSLQNRGRKISKKVSKSSERKNSGSIALQTSKPPKFLISRYMHEFLFYIVVELNESRQSFDINEELLKQWQQSEPSILLNEYKQELSSENISVRAYTKEITWRTFIPPLPNYPDKPAGWVCFVDTIERMPLSIFNKIFRIGKVNNNTLTKYLSHPIRQHYLMRQLPTELQYHINHIYLQRVCTTVLKLLNNMGLIQISKPSNPKDALSLWVYLNRRTQILDTTPSEASYSKVNPDRKYEELKYDFSNFDDVHQYWTQLHRICVYTKLGFRRKRTTESANRSKDLTFVQFSDFDEAPKLDEGKIPGDGAGAAGLSAYLFAHTFRNWSWMLHTSSKPKTIRPGREAVIGYNISDKQHRTLSVRKSRNYISPIKRTHHGTAVKRAFVKKSGTLRDAIDRDALKNMRTLRVSWHKDEDNLLKMSRAVYLYISAPVASLGLLTVGKICRDVIRQNLGILNKTSQACVRRMHFIVKMQRHIPEVPSWVHLLQMNDKIQQRYDDNFLQKLKIIYPNRSEYCAALSVHFIHILFVLYQIIHKAEKKSIIPAIQCQFSIPDSLFEFKRFFYERLSIAEEQISLYENPKSEYEQQIALAIGVLHSSLCCMHDKTTYTSQAFEIYKTFSEDVLLAAFAKARNDALVVANKRKSVQMLPSQLAGPAYSLSSQYQRRLIFLRIPYAIYDSFYAYFENARTTLFKAELEPNIASNVSQISKPLLELKSPHAGHLFFIAEGLACNFWNCYIKLPINILTVDAEQRHTLSPMDRILDHYHSIFDNAPETEYTKNFENEISEKQVRVKFHPANLSYKIIYNPYDFISKLPARYLHFFCALDHLHQAVDINFSKLHHKDVENNTISIECPFSCILKHSNYINAIERIVQEKRIVLNELSEMPPQKLLNLAMSGNSVTVQSNNLLTLVRMLESFWRDKEMANDLRDLGKVSSNVKANYCIDWYQVCNDILNFNLNEDDNDKGDEYEPTLNKEERIARAQDVFVVNLPTLQFETSATLNKKAKYVQHSGAYVPEYISEPDILRETILQKIYDESHWEYTDKTFPSIKSKLKNLGFNTMEQQHLEDLHNYIESHQLGVTIKDLLRAFPYKQFLSHALHILCSNFLIKRVGSATFMYIHKTHIRPWVVHTFHIKRLEREKLGTGVISLKRKHHEVKSNIGELHKADGISDSKRPKLVESTNMEEQKVSTHRPDSDFESEYHPYTSHKNDNTDKDTIVMKPQAWIRLNGSINRRVLDRWMGSILTECISRTGCSVQDICYRFPNLPPTDIMFLLEVLSDLKCLHLTEIQSEPVNLLSPYEDIKERIVYELYDPERTYITSHIDALTRMAIFIGKKKYNKQFV